MKKKATFLLVLTLTMTLFYNVIGYYLIQAYQKEQTWVASMQNIPDSEFQVIKLNASLYSFIDDTEMAFVNENVTINNKSYHIFKKKIQNNIIYLYYLRNFYESDAKECFTKIVDSQDFKNQSATSNPIKQPLKSFLKDYVFESNFDFKSLSFGSYHVINPTFFVQKCENSGFLNLPFSPPKTV